VANLAVWCVFDPSSPESFRNARCTRPCAVESRSSCDFGDLLHGQISVVAQGDRFTLSRRQRGERSPAKVPIADLVERIGGPRSRVRCRSSARPRSDRRVTLVVAKPLSVIE
jgi:hypothetical protein